MNNLCKKMLGAVTGCFLLLLPAFPGLSQDIEPSEPEIVLPNVILEIEDLSVENVKAVLPEEEIVPPEFEIPLPDAGDLQIEEPAAVPVLPQTGGGSVRQKEGKHFIAEGVLGAGTLNHFVSSFSLYQFEKEPEGKLLFRHEVLDGFSGEAIGSGYTTREDSIAGTVRVKKGQLKIEAEGSFDDLERGLQGNGDFYSKISRFARGRGNLEYAVSNDFILKGGINTSITTQLLTQSGSTVQGSGKSTEYLFSSSIEGRYCFERGFFGLMPRFDYRNGGYDNIYSLKRAEVRGLFGVDLNPFSRLDGNVSWFWSDEIQYLFPFNLTLLVYPTDLFSVSTSLGYRLQEYNLHDILSEYLFAGIPDALEDSSGWFFDINSHVNISQGWVVYGGLSLIQNSGLPSVGELLDEATGLFPLHQEEAVQLTYEVGVRWNRSMNFSTYFSWISEFLDRPRFFPANRFNFEASWNSRSGKYGGVVSSVFYTGVNDFVQAPLINVEGFYRFSDSLMLSAQADDVLYPVLDDPRYSWFPYVDMGLKITVKAHITF